MSSVDAQQARCCRILDSRMVGYRISPKAVGKSKEGTQCGPRAVGCASSDCRQGVEIDAFIPEEYWSLDAAFKSV